MKIKFAPRSACGLPFGRSLSYLMVFIIGFEVLSLSTAGEGGSPNAPKFQAPRPNKGNIQSKSGFTSGPTIYLGSEMAIRNPGIARSLASGDDAEADVKRIREILEKYRESQRSTPELSPEMVKQQIAELDNFIAANPDSPLTPSLRIDLAAHYYEQGRFSKALIHWTEAWKATAPMTGGHGKFIADHSLVHRSRLLAALGRFEELAPLVRAFQFRVMAEPHLAQIWGKTIEGFSRMRRNPAVAYRCGTFALNNVSEVLHGKFFAGIWKIPSSTNGFSLAELYTISKEYGLELIPAFRKSGAEFIYPAVIHWKQNHYAAIKRFNGEQFLVEDPTFVTKTWMDAEALEEEASGYFLIPKSAMLPAGWRYATRDETLEVFGKGYPQDMDDDGPFPCMECCEPGGGGSGTGGGECGMATWEVQEPNINLTISDIPMLFKAAYGPDFVMNLRWRQRNIWAAPSSHSHFSDSWESDLLSWIDGYPGVYSGLGETTFKLHWGDGATYQLHFADQATISDQDYISGMWAERTVVGNVVTALTLHFRNGSVERYSRDGSAYDYRMDWRKDATTLAMTFNYDDPNSNGWQSRLTRVTLADGSQFNFAYNDINDVYRITGVTGPDSRSVGFGYTAFSGTVVLTSITDAVGMVSSFEYDQTRWWITNMVTPYGTTTFTLWDQGFCNLYTLDCPGVDRAVTILEPGGTKQLYLFYDNGTLPNEMAGKIPNAFSGSQIPSYDVNDPPLQTLDTSRNKNNSHYWNRQQAELLSTLTVQNLTAADYLLSQTKHWLIDNNNLKALDTLGWQLSPSPDGTSEGQPVFYDYAGKPAGYNDYAGTKNLPTVISQRMPDGTTHYQYFERNNLGLKTSETERWVQAGTVTFRTNTFLYASGTGNAAVDNMLMVRHTGPNNKIILGRALHSTYNDQIGYETNAAGEFTTFDYDANRRLATRQTHAGLLSTFTYDGTSHRLLKVVDSISGTPLRTNSYTWLNGYERTHTDPRGFTRTFDYDFLGRLTQITYDDDGGTTESVSEKWFLP